MDKTIFINKAANESTLKQALSTLESGDKALLGPGHKDLASNPVELLTSLGYELQDYLEENANKAVTSCGIVIYDNGLIFKR